MTRAVYEVLPHESNLGLRIQIPTLGTHPAKTQDISLSTSYRLAVDKGAVGGIGVGKFAGKCSDKVEPAAQATPRSKDFSENKQQKKTWSGWTLPDECHPPRPRLQTLSRGPGGDGER